MGEWNADGDCVWGPLQGEGLQLIAQTFDGDDKANARLIAAAPDLLEFIKDALPIIEREAEQRQNWGERHNAEGNRYATEMRDLQDRIEVLILKVKGEL